MRGRTIVFVSFSRFFLLRQASFSNFIEGNTINIWRRQQFIKYTHKEKKITKKRKPNRNHPMTNSRSKPIRRDTIYLIHFGIYIWFSLPLYSFIGGDVVLYVCIGIYKHNNSPLERNSPQLKWISRETRWTEIRKRQCIRITMNTKQTITNLINVYMYVWRVSFCLLMKSVTTAPNR